MEGLNYVEEHQSCLNYRIPQEANIRVLHFPQGTVQFIDTSESLLVFILKGEAWVTSGPYKEVIHRAGYMSLQPRNSTSYIRILTDCTCICCHFPRQATLCDHFSLQQLPQYIPDGFEYHFTHFKRGSVYAGAEIGFNVGSTKSSLTYEDPNDIQVNSESKGSIFGFGVGVFTGIDFYLTENLYLGAELGLGYQTTKTTPNKSSTNGSTTVESSNYTSTSSFGFNCEPSIRLGWTF